MSTESGPYAALVEALDAALPAHKGGLYLEHNAHRGSYMTVEEYCAEDEWVSAAERERAVERDEMWSLQWYPDTPVGFYRIVASSLAAVLGAVDQAGSEVSSG